jgi:hypothetical protein
MSKFGLDPETRAVVLDLAELGSAIREAHKLRRPQIVCDALEQMFVLAAREGLFEPVPPVVTSCEVIDEDGPELVKQAGPYQHQLDAPVEVPELTENVGDGLAVDSPQGLVVEDVPSEDGQTAGGDEDDAEAVAYRRIEYRSRFDAATNSVVTEASVDGGVTWFESGDVRRYLETASTPELAHAS